MHLLVFFVMLGTPAENLQVLWLRVKAIYQRDNTKHQFSTMKLSMFTGKNGGCKLRGKAGEVQGLGPAILEIWKEYWTPEVELHTKIELCLRLGCHLDDVLDADKSDVVLSGLCFVSYKIALHIVLRGIVSGLK